MTYIWVVIIAAIIFTVVLLIVALHHFRVKHGLRKKQRARAQAAENNKMFLNVIRDAPLNDPSPAPPRRTARSVLKA